jgi:glycerol-3-phosphate dehydrogenase
MTERADVVVVGGGVIGCAIAWALASRGIEGVVVVEREPDVGEGASKANSAIVHTGFDAKPGTLEATMLRRAAALWPEVVERLAVPFLPVGAVMLARSPDDVARLRTAIRPTAETNGVDTVLLERSEVRELAPYVTEDAIAGLLVSDESIIDPFWLTRAYAEAAMAGGARVIRAVAVAGLAIDGDGVDVTLGDGRRIRAAQVVDAGGLWADEVARMAGDADVTITPRRGQFLVSEESFGVDRIVLPVPGPMGKGMLVTPIVFGGLLLGPTALDVDDKGDRGTRADDTEAIRRATAALVPAIRSAIPVRAFTGLRPVPSTGEFMLGPSSAGDRLWLACGIRSTGISVSPAIAERVADDVLAARGWAARPRAIAPPPFELPESPGRVVCLCRGVSEGELRTACARPLGPTTLDAVKRRGGAMFGDCQGNLCAVDVAGVLADHQGVPITAIEKGPAGSWVFVRAEPPAAVPAGARPAADSADAADGSSGSPGGEDVVDVVVIGLGHAGGAALTAVRDAGLAAVGVDRRAGQTAVGLVHDGSGWAVELQHADGSRLVRGRTVLLATGGYVEPREQRSIAGPRPAGVVTSDLVEAALAAGVLPGRSAVVVGSGPLADESTRALEAAGVHIAARLDAPPAELRGAARLEAVRADDGWIDADTLVLADRLLPQPFLLRSLGLVDARSGIPAPADPNGRLPLDGLWAAGCCVRADASHGDCADAGRRVAAEIIRGLVAPPA